MTAIGFVMFLFGALGSYLWSHPTKWECIDWLFAPFFFGGILLMLAGITLWLWRVMP